MSAINASIESRNGSTASTNASIRLDTSDLRRVAEDDVKGRAVRSQHWLQKVPFQAHALVRELVFRCVLRAEDHSFCLTATYSPSVPAILCRGQRLRGTWLSVITTVAPVNDSNRTCQFWSPRRTRVRKGECHLTAQPRGSIRHCPPLYPGAEQHGRCQFTEGAAVHVHGVGCADQKAPALHRTQLPQRSQQRRVQRVPVYRPSRFLIEPDTL